MGNTCHCIEDKDKQREMSLANDSKYKHGKYGRDHDDESNVGDDALEQEFNRNDPEMNAAASKIQGKYRKKIAARQDHNPHNRMENNTKNRPNADPGNHAPNPNSAKKLDVHQFPPFNL